VNRALAFVYRLCAGVLLGAQVFFAAVAAQAAFPRDVAALTPGHPARTAAAQLVGHMLAALDRMTLALAAVTVVCAVLLGRRGVQRAARAAVPPLIAGTLAGISAAVITPAIHAMRLAGQTSGSQFGMLHAGSTLLLLGEMLLLTAALWMGPDNAPAPGS
jgi:hypothetical protein